MELYELSLHFPCKYHGFQYKHLSFTCKEYFRCDDEAVQWAQNTANAFVSPAPSFWYLSDGPGINIWTDDIQCTKNAIKYNLLDPKPIIRKILDF